VFLGGAPGSGKGTNSSHIANLRNFSAPTIVVSDLLNTPACRLLKDHGIMVDDNFVFNVLLEELEKPMYRNGVVVDGFPRTATQAKYLTNFYHAYCDSLSSLRVSPPPPCIMFVMLHVDETSSIERQLARGSAIAALNKTRAALDMPLLEVRQTDTDVKASQARYTVFKEQLQAVMTLGQTFPLMMVDARDEVEIVRRNLADKMASFPAPF
jgi:adenylate kinase